MSWRNSSANGGFIHSVKVPRIYKVASSIVKKVVEEGESLKSLVYGSRHQNIRGVYALVVETIKNLNRLNELIRKCRVLEHAPRLEPWLARVLMTEMLYRKKELKGQSKPVQTILSYRNKFMKSSVMKLESTTTEVVKPRYVRVNTLHRTLDEIVKIFRKDGWIYRPTPSDYPTFLQMISSLKADEFTKDFHVKELLVFPHSAKFYNNDLYIGGSIILQDKASCLPVCLLEPPPNSTVFDMCAAPGMKTSQLSARMKNKGVIYATEMNESRYKTLCQFIETAGCTNVIPINVDALQIGLDDNSLKNDNSWYEDVEYILVDPSCSGTGMIERRNIFANEEEDAQRIKKLCAFQFKLLLHALTNFPRVKRIVYSTCSTLSVENEKVVEDVLRKLKEIEGKAPLFELKEAMKDIWPRRGSTNFEHGHHCLYADPKEDCTNGFFVAVFERVADGV